MSAHAVEPAWPDDLLDDRLRRLAEEPTSRAAERARAARAATAAQAERTQARAEREPRPPDNRTPVELLRHWSEYETVGEWYTAFRGYVPSATALGLSQRMDHARLTFREAYAAMLGRGGSISVHVGDEPPCEICALLHTPQPEVAVG